jgi:plastocyanin
LRRALILCVGLAILSIAGGAHASSSATSSTFTVFLGEQSEIPGGFKKSPVLLNQFMPSTLTVAAGDKVTFSSASFHTVTYTPKPIPLLMPDPAKGTYQNIVDSAGQPFYFDGRPKLIYNLAAFGPFGPKTVSGKTPTSSGALSPQGPKAPPATATYTFPQPGTFKLVCTLHPGMEARVVVKAAGSAVPKTPAQVQAQALLQQTAGWAKGKALLASTKVAPNTVAMGVGGKVALMAFLPKVLRVKAGTTVSFPNKSPSEVHNLVFGPPKYVEKLQKQTDLTPQGPTGPNQVTPFLPFASDPKPYAYAGNTMHGNGFFVSELTSGSPIGLPRASRVTFSTPGTYKFFCWIHGPDMGGTVVVTP